MKILYVQIPKDLQAQEWDSQIPNGLAWRTPVGPDPRSRVERAALGSLGVPRGLLENGLGAARGSGSVQALQSAAEGVVPGVVSLGADGFMLHPGEAAEQQLANARTSSRPRA